MHLLRCIYAEWLLVYPRLMRTHYGALLLLLAVTLLLLRSRGLDPLSASLHAGALSAVIGAAFVASYPGDRAALGTALTHPTTALAIAVGRWIAVFAPAVVVVLVASGWQAAGVVTAAAVGGCALAAVLAGGNAAAVALFLLMALAGAMPPERLVALAYPGVVRIAAASVLELGPALWHYRDVAAGDALALLHGAAWAGLGVLLAGGLVAWRAR